MIQIHTAQLLRRRNNSRIFYRKSSRPISKRLVGLIESKLLSLGLLESKLLSLGLVESKLLSLGLVESKHLSN